MKRDLNLIRKMLLEMEKSESDALILAEKIISDIDSSILIYQAQLMLDEGWIIGHGIGYSSKPGMMNFEIKRLTSKGHDFINLIRSEFNWALVSNKLESLTIEQIIERLK